MLLNYTDLLNDGAIDKRYKNILLKIYKDSLHEYHTTWLVRSGMMSPKVLINYLNNIKGIGIRYITPTIENDKYLNLEEFIPDANTRKIFMEVCNKYKIFPYKVKGTHIHWLAEEREDPEDETTTLMDTLIDCAETFSLKFKQNKQNYITTIDYTIRPLYEEELRKFSIQNKCPYNSSDIYRIKPEFLAMFYITKGIVTRASDIYFDPKVDGIQVSYSILNDYIMDNFLLLDDVGKKKFNDEVLFLTGIEAKDRPAKVVVDSSIKDLGEQENKFDGRVNLFNNLGFDATCIRVVDKSKKLIPFDELNISESRRRRMKELAQNAHGLILVAGPTGSGKSTTLCSYLTFLQQMFPYKRIETVEDPVEQVIKQISQLSLENSGATYDDVAQSLTRRNASILFEGEFNTPKTIHFGVNSTLQNLLVISTIHSIDGKSVPDRVRMLTIEQPSIYEALLTVIRGIIHQTMLKKTCPDCLEMVSRDDPRITNGMNTVLDYYGYRENYVPIASPKCDCPKCEGRGFLITEPVIAVEICVIDDSLQEDITGEKKGKISKTLHEDMRTQNMTGVQDALDYMREHKLDWIQIWNKFSLFNKVRSCVQPGDAKYSTDKFNTIS